MSKTFKNNISLVPFILIFLICSYANARDYIILTHESPEVTIPAGTQATVFGTSEPNHVTIESGAEAKLLNFSGNNIITILSDSSLFTVFRSGSTVTFYGADGTSLIMPATSSEQSVVFNDTAKTIEISPDEEGIPIIELGGEEVTLSDTSIVTHTEDFESFNDMASFSDQWLCSSCECKPGGHDFYPEYVDRTAMNSCGTITLTALVDSDQTRKGSEITRMESKEIKKKFPPSGTFAARIRFTGSTEMTGYDSVKAFFTYYESPNNSAPCYHMEHDFEVVTEKGHVWAPHTGKDFPIMIAGTHSKKDDCDDQEKGKLVLENKSLSQYQDQYVTLIVSVEPTACGLNMSDSIFTSKYFMVVPNPDELVVDMGRYCCFKPYSSAECSPVDVGNDSAHKTFDYKLNAMFNIWFDKEYNDSGVSNKQSMTIDWFYYTPNIVTTKEEALELHEKGQDMDDKLEDDVDPPLNPFYVEKHYIASGPYSGCENPAPEPCDEFALDHYYVLAYNYVHNMKETDETYMDWKAPDGTSQRIYNPISFDGDACMYNGIIPSVSGKWSVDFYCNDIFQYTDSFEVLDSGNMCIEKHYIASAPYSGCENPPAEQNNIFKFGEGIVAYNYISNMEEGDTNYMIWYAPDGSNFRIDNSPVSFNGSGCCYTGGDPNNTKIEGAWSVEFYYNDVKQYTDTFTVSDTIQDIKEIKYSFGDATVPPEYHRSYTIKVIADNVSIIVDSYGDILTDEEYDITSEQFIDIKNSFDINMIKNCTLGNDMCCGGTSETVSCRDGENEIFFGSVYHCGGEDTGNLCGNITNFANDVKNLIPNLENLLRIEIQ